MRNHALIITKEFHPQEEALSEEGERTCGRVGLKYTTVPATWYVYIFGISMARAVWDAFRFACSTSFPCDGPTAAAAVVVVRCSCKRCRTLLLQAFSCFGRWYAIDALRSTSAAEVSRVGNETVLRENDTRDRKDLLVVPIASTK